jgi:hypothetical protein
MELVNARRSRTVLTEANEGDIIAAVGRVPKGSCRLTQVLGLFEPRVLDVLRDNQLHRYNSSNCVSRCFHTRG